MTSEHTQKWSEEYLWHLLKYGSKYPSSFDHLEDDGLYRPHQDDAKRIVAVINATAGLSVEEIEAAIHEYKSSFVYTNRKRQEKRNQ